jgi:two-component system nitrate/nitrite sensor histidine kinase NarX
VNVNVEGDPEWGRGNKLDSAGREHVVRIAREAIANAAAHGGASRIEVAFDRRRSALRLCVSDDGCGIREGVPQSTHGFGLPMMRARARALGGRLTARRAPNGGTEVELLVP